MRFGPVPLRTALGAVLAHGTKTATGRIPKGMILDASAIDALADAGYDQVIVAQLDPGDVLEDDAALQVATGMMHPSLRMQVVGTGRVNLLARHHGLFGCNGRGVARLNSVDQAITLATLPEYSRVRAGDMVATAKIIPFAVPQSVVDLAVQSVQTGHGPLIATHPFQPLNCIVVQTDLPTLKPSVAEKTVRLTQDRITDLGGQCRDGGRVAHDAAAVRDALVAAGMADLVVVFGASAICDAQDVIPAAIRAAGGVVERVGMPVDPGNLLVLGQVGRTHVIGAPGCARSPKENGFDWVLARLFAGLPPSSDDIATMGVGGLLTEIPTRPRPRAARREST